MSETFVLRTPHSASLALQCLAYRALGHAGQDEHGKLETVPPMLLTGVVPELKRPAWRPVPVEPESVVEDTSDWPDDHKLDDPRRGQAKWINGR